jgi:hypothetical protein
MHPEIARQLIAHRNEELMAMAMPRRRAARGLAPARPRRLARPRASVPVWRVTWSRLAVPAGGGRSWLIVISAHRARLGT